IRGRDMELSEEQRDAISELINIGFSRAAASLSDLTGRRIILHAPRISIHKVSELEQVLEELAGKELASVHQIFSGNVSGDAVIMLDLDGARALVKLLSEEDEKELTESGREVLMEVGNILLNACLGMFGNLLKVHVTFSVPRLNLESLNAMLETLQVSEEGICYALLVYTTFNVKELAITGFLVIILGVVSLERLIQAVENWARISPQV
ncbi:MAG: chemotaxis protein CheC, partial [Candidatus Aminicenantes bacterium]|nr:chemotaxis protein CheC [Candidatus Aminicenantes bacterium]